MGRNFLVSPNFRLSDWEGLRFTSEADWELAIKIVEDRIRGRILVWTEKIKDERFSGFAVLALDCTLLESLYGFQHGRSTRDTKAVYEDMLQRAPFFFDKPVATSFYSDVRCGILHDGETRNLWLIEQHVPPGQILAKNSKDEFILNRTEFHKAVVCAVESWVSLLKQGDRDARENMKKRMDEIIKKHSQA